jgi:hypothetical protein
MSALLTDRGVTAARIGGCGFGKSKLVPPSAPGPLGYLLDRFFAPRLALGIAMLMFGVSGKTALAAAFLVGMGLGAEGDVIAYSLTRYFALRAFGSAYGYAFGSFLLAGALGAYLWGLASMYFVRTPCRWADFLPR